MKNMFKFFSIVAMVALVAFSFVSCEDPGNDDVPKTLVITGVPGTLEGTGITGKTITVAICDNSSSTNSIVALNQVSYVNTTVTIPLLSGNKNKKGGDFTGTGKFYIMLLIDIPGTKDNLDDDTIYAYTGAVGGQVPKQYDIQDATTTLTWDNFAKQ